MPADTSTAGGLAKTYALKNGFTLPTSGITISGTVVPDDSITVKVDKNAPTFFAKVFGVATVPVHAEGDGEELGDGLGEVRRADRRQHPSPDALRRECRRRLPMLRGADHRPLGKTGAPGAFALIDLDGNKGGTGASDLAAWIQNGFQDYPRSRRLLLEHRREIGTRPRIEDALNVRAPARC